MTKLLVILLAAVALVIVACASGGSESLCDAEEGPCIGVRFDGENCMVEEPTDTGTGEFAIILVNESDGFARFELTSVNEGRTLEDLEELIATSPNVPNPPDWTTDVGISGESVPAGETVSVERIVLPGEYGALCVSNIPLYVYYGGAFTIES
jgi:hypothetical protein